VGRDVPVPVLRRMTPWAEEELWGWLRELERRKILMPTWMEQEQGLAEAGRIASELSSVWFVHDKLREVAYEQLAEERRGRLHRAAAEALEGLPEAERRERLAGLAWHWEQGGAPDAARPLYLEAAQYAQQRYAPVEAERLYRRFLDLTQRPTRESVLARHALVTSVLLVSRKRNEPCPRPAPSGTARPKRAASGGWDASSRTRDRASSSRST
jgi:hypothetical protein